MVERARRLGAYMQATATSQTALRDTNSVMQRTAADLSRMVKKSETPGGTVPRHLSLGQGAWVVLTGRCGCLRWVERLGAGLAAVTVNRAVLIWKLTQVDFLTIRAHSLLVRLLPQFAGTF